MAKRFEMSVRDFVFSGITIGILVHFFVSLVALLAATILYFLKTHSAFWYFLVFELVFIGIIILVIAISAGIYSIIKKVQK